MGEKPYLTLTLSLPQRAGEGIKMQKPGIGVRSPLDG
jgi:hypothetical protein